MQDLLLFLELHYVSVFLLILIIFVLVWMINWLAWIFSLGRFKGDKAAPNNSGRPNSQGKGLYLLGEFIVNIINDFRHLLALVLVLIFAFALGYVFVVSPTSKDLIDGLQAVMSTLGTLVGSIVGYYFGESAVKKSLKKGSESKLDEAIIQEKESPRIETAPKPPNVD
jgi:hypothetical protein